MSLIHGSQGIVYFVHQFAPTFREDGIFNYPALVTAVSNINHMVTTLAPVLNSANVSNVLQVASSTSGEPVDAMVKQYGGSTYIFSAAMRNKTTTGTFTLTGVSGTNVTVLGENRQLTVSGGKFQDSFAAYGVHLYQVAATIVTNAPAAAATFMPPAFVNNNIQFMVTGTAGSNYVVQVSSSPLGGPWTSLATNTAPFLFVDTNVAADPQRFYRAMVAY